MGRVVYTQNVSPLGSDCHFVVDLLVDGKLKTYRLAVESIIVDGKTIERIPTATLLEHALLAQGFMGAQKAAFPRHLRPQNRVSTGANLVNALK